MSSITYIQSFFCFLYLLLKLCYIFADDPSHKGLIHSSSVDMLSLEYDDDPHETASHDSLVTATG